MRQRYVLKKIKPMRLAEQILFNFLPLYTILLIEEFFDNYQKTEAVLTRTHNLCFGARIRKIGIALHTQVWGSRGYTLDGHVILLFMNAGQRFIE